jgi:protein gp37
VGADSKIQWTHHTFNAWLGCAKVHTGCMNCYAKVSQAVVMRKGGPVHWGEVWQGGDRAMLADSTWAKPMSWARAAAKAGERHRVFCSSEADVLEVPSVPEKWPSGWDEKQIAWATERVQRIAAELAAARERLWDIIRKTAYVETGTVVGMPHWSSYPGLDWLLLTKRPENWRLVPEDVRPLVWLGTSASDQETLDSACSRLVGTAGFRLTFLSLEPLVGPVDLSEWLPSSDGFYDTPEGPVHRKDWPHCPFPGWVILGGESGPKARPCREAWVAKAVKQVEGAWGVSAFVKQMGSVWASENDAKTTVSATGPILDSQGREVGVKITEREAPDHKGGDPKNWPEDLRVRDFPRFTR